MHDPRPLQRDHAIAERLTHPPDLPVPTLCEDDAKLITSDSHHPAGSRDAPENDYSAGHVIEE